MRSLVFYVSVVGFLLGISIASVFTKLPDSWWLLLVGSALLAIAARGRWVASTQGVLGVGIFFITLALGITWTERYETKLTEANQPVSGETVTIEGVVVQEPDQRETSTHLYVKVEEATVLVTVDRYQDIDYGDRIVATGKLEAPKSFTTDLGRTFNYPGYLQARGVTQMMRFAEVSVVGQGEGNAVVSWLLGVKTQILQTIEQYLPEPQAGLAQGLLLGVKRALGEDLEETFRRTGIIHIVVLSGYNIMLVVAFVMYLLSFVLPWRGRLVVGLAAIIAFALMVGLSATVLRASMMAALALVARLFGRTYTVFRALLVAGLVMLILNPYLLVYDVGFQLSFLATLGLIVIAPQLEQSLARVPTIIEVRGFLVATLATQVFVLPVLLYQIGEFSVVSVLVNVLVLPVVPLAMLGTFLVVVADVISPLLAAPISWFTYGSLWYIIAVPSLFGQLPFASFVVPAFPFWIVPVAYGAIGWGLYYWFKELTIDSLGSEWTVEEESTIQSLTVTANNDTPVFFR